MQGTLEYLGRQSRTEHVNCFERKGESLKESRKKDGTAERLIIEETEHLHQRKEDLKELYQKEREQWASRVEQSIQDDKNKVSDDIRTRVLRLKEAREQERKRFVKDSLERQWRDGQDELRSLKSKEQVSSKAVPSLPTPPLPCSHLLLSASCSVGFGGLLNKQAESNMHRER